MAIELVVFDVSGTLIGRDGAPYPGMVDTLLLLEKKGYKLALATSLGRGGLQALMEKWQLEPFFASTQTSSDAAFKPSAEMLNYISLETGCPPEKMLMVGDSEPDIFMAHNAGASACAACWGEGQAGELQSAHPTFVAQTLDELVTWLDHQ